MASLYRKSKVLEFDDGESVTVRELEVSVLVMAQRGEIELTEERLIKECAGLEKSDIGIDAYNEIMDAIDKMHSDVFENSEEGKEDDDSSKKNSLSS